MNETIKNLAARLQELTGLQDAYLLTVLIFLPVIGAIVLAFFNERSERQRGLLRWGALFVALLDLLVALLAWARFDLASEEKFQFLVRATWIPTWGASYQVGADGLSLLLVLLTTLLGVLAVLSSFTAIRKREKEYYILLLLLQSGVLGTFLSLDLLLFYLFWELMLIPLYFLIGIWGSKDRIYATMKFVIYTLTGSLLMLVAILYLYLKVRGINGGVPTFDYLKIVTLDLNETEAGFGLSLAAKRVLFLAFLLAFAIKVPFFPFHTWLPDAHTEAPTAGSVILAGVLLKTGVYGILRFCIPFFPEAAAQMAPFLVWLSIIAIMYGALTAMAQKDAKRLVAYSSVSHMGFVTLGIFAGIIGAQDIALRGGMLQMINHGISTGGLFLCVGMIYERRHTRLMEDFGGLAQNMRRFAVLTIIIVLSSAALPGLNGFIGEALVIFGVFKVRYLWAALAAIGVILSVCYLLLMVQKMFFGPLDKPANRELRDLTFREVVTLLPLIAMTVWIGLYPKPFLKLLERNSADTIAQIQQVREAPKTILVYHPPRGR